MVKTINTIDLLPEAQAGCQWALNRLSIEVCDRIYPALLKMTRNEDLSHDLMQETLLVMLRCLKTLKCVEGFWGWILSIARSRVYDHFRKKQHRTIIESMDFDEINDGNNISILDSIVNMERNEFIAESVENLKKQYREVVYLRYFENRSYNDIASISGCTTQQARSRFFRAKRTLRHTLCTSDFGMD